MDVACEPSLDLVGRMALLGIYFYTKIQICNNHLALLAQSVQVALAILLKLYNKLDELWHNTLSLKYIATFVNSNPD